MGSEYIITSDGSFVSDDQLIHVLARGNKGWVKPNHKYINRKWKMGDMCIHMKLILELEL